MAVIRNLVLIYRLRDDLGSVFYVGRTHDPGRRLDQHRRAFGYEPIMQILEAIPIAVGRWYMVRTERSIIEFHLLGGYRLINLRGVDQRIWERVGDMTYPLRRARKCWRLRSMKNIRRRKEFNRPVEKHFPAELYVESKPAGTTATGAG